jgi:hypothetical protein
MSIAVVDLDPSSFLPSSSCKLFHSSLSVMRLLSRPCERVSIFLLTSIVLLLHIYLLSPL